MEVGACGNEAQASDVAAGISGAHTTRLCHYCPRDNVVTRLWLRRNSRKTPARAFTRAQARKLGAHLGSSSCARARVHAGRGARYAARCGRDHCLRDAVFGGDGEKPQRGAGVGERGRVGSGRIDTGALRGHTGLAQTHTGVCVGTRGTRARGLHALVFGPTHQEYGGVPSDASGEGRSIDTGALRGHTGLAQTHTCLGSAVHPHD